MTVLDERERRSPVPPVFTNVRGHRLDIDGMRAVAVLSVLAFHTQTPGFSGGFVGVDIFFVLSGYLICSILVREFDGGTFSIGRFYERRCKRILPALYAVLLFCMGAALLLLSPDEARKLGGGLTATALSASNVHFYLQGSYFDRGGQLNPLLMTWSLAVEEQFYIVFPMLMILLYRRSRKNLFLVMALLCGLSFALSVYAEFRRPEFNFYMPFTRAWELGAGTLLAIWQARKSVAWVRRPGVQHALSVTGLLLVGACVVLYTPSTRFPGLSAVPPVLGTLLLLVAPEGVMNRMMALRPFTAVGLISYSLYLWHWPLLSLGSIISPEPLTVSARAGLIAVAAVMAVLSYFFVEGPFRNARYASRQRVLSTYAVITVAFAIAGFAFTRSGGFAQRVPAVARVEQAAELNRVHDCITTSDRGPIQSTKCVPAPSVKPAVALLGDSHAEAVAPALRGILEKQGVPLVMMTSYSCPPLKGVTRYLPGQPQHYASCARFNGKALEVLRGRKDVSVVVLVGAWPMLKEDVFEAPDYTGDPSKVELQQSTRQLLDGLHGEIQALEEQGKRVVLMDDVPPVPFVPLDRVRAQALPLRGRLATLMGGKGFVQGDTVDQAEAISPAAEQVRNALLGMARTDAKLTVVDAKAAFCRDGRCRFEDGENLYYTDNSHISRFGAAKVLALDGVMDRIRP